MNTKKFLKVLTPLSLLLLTFYSPQLVNAQCSAIASIDFAAAHPSQVTQPASTDDMVYWGNAGNSTNTDNPGGKWRIESLEPQDYVCFDEVPFFVELRIAEDAPCEDYTVSLPLSWLCNTTGQAGIGVTQLIGYRLNPNDDPGSNRSIGGDDELLTLVDPPYPQITGTPLESKMCDFDVLFLVSGLDPGETVIVRIDVLLDCDLDSRPTGNLQANLGTFQDIQITAGNPLPGNEGTDCLCDNLQGGAQTIPWKVALPTCPEITTMVNTSPVCEGDVITFTADPSGLGTYTFFIDNNTNGTFDTGDDHLQTGTDHIYIYDPDATPPVILIDQDVVTVEIITAEGCAYNDASTVTINAIPSTPSTTGDERCGPGVVNLSASGCAGTLTWYDAASGGSVVNTGSTYSPSLTTTTSYWVTCTVDGCESDPTMVTGTVDEPVSAGEDGTSDFCEGDPAQTNVNLFALLLGTADVGGTWTETSAVSSGLTLPGAGTHNTDLDFTGVSVGVYTFKYTVTAAGSTCPPDDAMVTVTIVDCCEDETAFAFQDGNCFRKRVKQNGNSNGNITRWGWYVSIPYSDFTSGLSLMYDFVAGAGRCDYMPGDPSSKGTKVGVVAVEIDGNDLTVSFNVTDYDLSDDIYYELGTVHVNVDCQLPKKLAPGQYNGKDYGTVETMGTTAAMMTFNLSELNLDCSGGDVIIIAHAEVDVCYPIDFFLADVQPETVLFETWSELSVEDQSSLSISAYPNPAHDYIDLDLLGWSNGDTRIEIVDMLGRMVKEIEIENVGSDRLRIDLPASLGDGVYFIRLQDTDVREVVPFIIMRN